MSSDELHLLWENASLQRRLRQLWQSADWSRSSKEPNGLQVLQWAARGGLIPRWRDLAGLAAAAGALELVDPAIVADFLLAFTDGEPPKRVLDPWAGLGVTIAALESAGRVHSGVAIEINPKVFEFAKALRGESPIDSRLGDASLILADGLGAFDLVVGSPPVGLPRAVLETREPRITLRASKTYTMLVQAALTLGPGGALVAVLPESFFAASNRLVRDALGAASVYPSAALSLPLRVFSSNLPLSLVVLTHEHHDSLFAAELDPSADMSAVVGNLRARREGRLPQLGRLVPVDRFVSWRSTLLEAEITEAARAIDRLFQLAEPPGDPNGGTLQFDLGRKECRSRPRDAA